MLEPLPEACRALFYTRQDGMKTPMHGLLRLDLVGWGEGWLAPGTVCTLGPTVHYCLWKWDEASL